MVRTLALLGLALLVVVSAGCGGGRGVTTTVTNTPPPSGNVRLLQPGDSLRYEVTGYHFDGWHSWPVTGSYSETVLSENVTVPGSTTTAAVVSQEIVLDTFKTEVLYDQTKLAWIAQRDADGFKRLEAKINVSERYYITQDADGTIWTYGGVSGDGMYDGVPRSGVEYWVSVPSTGRYKLLGSPLAVGNGWSADVQQSNGMSYRPSFVVSTSGVSSVPAGDFLAHYVRGNGRMAGMVGEIDMWLAPDVGAPTQFSVTATDYVPNEFANTGYPARTFTLTFKLAAKSRQRV